LPPWFSKYHPVSPPGFALASMTCHMPHRSW
jgi:hypothetical protein